MAQYIKKSAIVAEIERRNVICKKVALDLRTQENKDYYQGKAEAYKEVLDILDTLEVKEVDLCKEIEEQITKYYNDCEQKLKEMDDNDNDFSFMTLDNFAKYFFELGLKAQKEE